MPDTVASLYEQLYPLANVYKIHTFTSGGTFTVTGTILYCHGWNWWIWWNWKC